RRSTRTGAMTIPGEAGIPSRTRPCDPDARSASPLTRPSLLPEAAGYEVAQRLESLLGIVAPGADVEGGAALGGEHHHPHDALAADLHAVLLHPHLAGELVGELDELRRRTGVETVLVRDGDVCALFHHWIHE